MNRRQIMIAMGATLAASCTAIPVWARPAATFGGRARWMGDTLDSHHAALMVDSIRKMLDAGRIYTTGEMYMGHRIELTDPTFTVMSSDVMWHPTRGYRYEPALELEVRERGILIGRCRMFSNRDYEAYWERPLPAEQPMYGIKMIHTPYNHPITSDIMLIRDDQWQVVERRAQPLLVTVKELEDKLGTKAISLDDRWLRALAKKGAFA